MNKFQELKSGDAVIELNPLTRRFCIIPTNYNPTGIGIKTYYGYGCCYLKCQFPDRTCNNCLHKHSVNVIF